MIRKIINIDENRCNGCGICADACHEGAIGIKDGKAKLLRDDYCDGLGDCLPTCPTGAITFVERDAAAYDEAAVKANMMAKTLEKELLSLQASCQGDCSSHSDAADSCNSKLSNWPVQIQLAPLRAPSFEGADLLIAADCTAYAYADFHDRFIAGRTALIGCPKLDSTDYSEKLTEIFRQNAIKTITAVRMEVPCCGGLVQAIEKAISASGKALPLSVITISTEGAVL